MVGVAKIEYLSVKKGDLYRRKKYARKIVATEDIWVEIPKTSSVKLNK